MKKFTKILMCLLLCVFGLGLVACDGRTDKEKAFTYPSANDKVYGNGGMAVKKGDYLYYVNGFLSVDSSEHVQNGSYSQGALLLVKLDSTGEIVKGENELLTDEYYITISNKLCGFEATSLYISGDYLYFTSPCQENEGGANAKDETWAKERVDFNRIKLDKTSDVECVYRSEIGHDDLNFEYYSSNGNTFILIHENGTNLEDSSKSKALIRVDCNEKSSVEIARNVSSVDMNDGNNIFFSMSEEKDSKTSYYLKKHNIYINETETYATFSDSYGERTVKFVGGNYVYVTYSRSSSTVLERYSIVNKVDKKVVNYASNIFDSMLISELGDEIIAIKGNEIHFLNQDDVMSEKIWKDQMIKDEDAESITVIGLTNGCVVYYDQDNNLKSVSYSNCLLGEKVEIQTIATLEDFDSDYFDISSDDNYLYYYKTVGSHEYLHRIKIVNNNNEKEEMIGVYLEADIPQDEAE